MITTTITTTTTTTTNTTPTTYSPFTPLHTTDTHVSFFLVKFRKKKYVGMHFFAMEQKKKTTNHAHEIAKCSGWWFRLRVSYFL
jgi:hypothetical protein